MRISTYRILLLFTISLSLYTCAKSLDFPEEDSIKEASVLSLINAVPINRNLDVYLSGNKITDDEFSFGTRTDYGYMLPGSKTVSVTVQSASQMLKTETFTLLPKAYSLFIVNEVEMMEFLLLEDDTTIPPTGKAKVRFVNLSPDAGPVDLSAYTYGILSTLATNIPFKNYTPFILVDPGNDISFLLKNSAGDQTIFGGVLEAGKTYTVFAKGLKRPTSNLTAFHGAIFEHK